jgi:hypothetical protein
VEEFTEGFFRLIVPPEFDSFSFQMVEGCGYCRKVFDVLAIVVSKAKEAFQGLAIGGSPP